MPRQYTSGPLPFVPFLAVELPCQQCNIRFLVPRKRASQRFCSQACVGAARRTPEIGLRCPVCGVTFSAKAYRGTTRRYCSQACLHASMQRRRVDMCPRCGTAKARPLSAKGAFCSMACRNARAALELLSDGTARLPLYGRAGVVAYVRMDGQDASWADQWRWHLSGGYAHRGTTVDGRRRSIFLHREVLGLVHGDARVADHIDGDPLNCTRANLRIVTAAGNHQNRRPNRNTSSRYRNVSWDATRQRWRVSVVDSATGKRVRVGDYVDQDEAGAAAREARLRLQPFAVD